MARFSFQLVLILAFLVVCFGFRPRTTGIIRTRNNVVASMTMENIFTDMSVARALGVLPLCIEATSKTTTINDPTAGMTPEEIQNYMSNVGGGMCGVPEIVRTAIGLGLNLSLITFGVFVVSYGKEYFFYL